MAKVGTQRVNGIDLDIHASDTGMWSLVEPADGENRAKTLGSSNELKKAVAQARAELNKRKIKVDVHFVLESSGERGIAYGIHGRNGTILTRIGGEAHELARYTKTLRPDTPALKILRLVECRKRIKELDQEIRDINKEYEMNLYTEVYTAIDAAVQDALDKTRKDKVNA